MLQRTSCSSQNSFDFHPDISNIGEIMEIRGKKYCLVGSYENYIGGGPCTTYLTREIPDYLIERQIGEGSHGTVWAGREKDNANNVVCIKIAKPGYESELRQEFRILRSMNHPNIICPEVLFEENDKLCMVLPYYQASAFAIKGKCNTLQIRRFCESIGNAIVHLHRLGYSHNDISLSNILISQNGDFVLSDFSSATKGTYDIDDLKLGCAAMELITGKKFIIFKYHTEKMIEESIDEAGITDEQLRGFLMQRFQSVPNAQWLHNSTNNALKENCSDFSIVERDGKYGLMNKYGTIVIPIENDSLSQVDYHHIPAPGPYRPPRIRCLFRKSDKCGSYLIDNDYALLEVEQTLQEWEDRKTWT